MIDESLLIPINLAKAVGERRSFVLGDSSEHRLKIEFFKHGISGVLVAKVHFGAETEGPPGLAHGGSVAAALSETMIFAAWAIGHAVLMMRLNTNFKQMLPLNTTALISTAVEMDGPKLTIKAVVQSATTETIYADAEGLFMAIPAAKFGVDGQKIAQMFSALQL